MAPICQSCGMPMHSDSDFGDEIDGSRSPDYCRYCYACGKFTDDTSMEDFIEKCSQFGEQAGMTHEQMRAHCALLFPQLKRWKIV